jgi:hypothetical protein
VKLPGLRTDWSAEGDARAGPVYIHSFEIAPGYRCTFTIDNEYLVLQSLWKDGH